MAPEIFKKSKSSKPWGYFRSSTNASWQLDTANPLMSGRWVSSPTSFSVVRAVHVVFVRSLTGLQVTLHSTVIPSKRRWRQSSPVTTSSSRRNTG